MFQQASSRVIAAGVLFVTCAGCGSTVPTAPTAPPPVSGPQPTYTLSGVVYAENADQLPIDGVRIESGNLGVYVGGLPLLATTALDGSYSASGLGGSVSLRLIKFGYEIASKNVSVSADTRFDFGLVPRATFVLSGVVFEMMDATPAPIEGVDVYCDSCGDGGHTGVTTDSLGRYSFPAVYSGDTPLIIGKAGYAVVAPNRTLRDGRGIKNVTVSGDTSFDVELVRQ